MTTMTPTRLNRLLFAAAARTASVLSIHLAAQSAPSPTTTALAARLRGLVGLLPAARGDRCYLINRTASVVSLLARGEWRVARHEARGVRNRIVRLAKV